MIYSKTNPVGIDVKINSIQSKIHKALLLWPSPGLITGQVDLYNRIYKLKEGLKLTPVKFATEFSKSIFTTDKAVVGYFYERTDPVNINGMMSYTIGNIFHVNLLTLYPSVTHRADAEFVKFISDIYRIEPYGFRLLSVVTGIDHVYTDFNFDEKLEDLHPYFIVRFDFNINYRI